jgi:CheY-like chemotaxis protein
MPKILLIEDEEILVDMYKERFETEGIETDVAYSVKEALDYLRAKKEVDLILLDLLLPRLDGIDLLRTIRRENLASKTPIVIFTNYDTPEVRRAAQELKVDGFLVKTNYTPSQVVERIKKYLGKDTNLKR